MPHMISTPKTMTQRGTWFTNLASSILPPPQPLYYYANSIAFSGLSTMQIQKSPAHTPLLCNFIYSQYLMMDVQLGVANIVTP